MFAPHLKSTGRNYVTSAALVVFALVFTPAVVIISGPPGYLSLSLALASAATCVTLAWFKWKRSSRLSVPSIVLVEESAK